MMEKWSKTHLILLLGAFIVHCSADPDLIFYESFEEPFEGRWTVSNKDEYTGVWKRSKSDGHNDHGLLVSQKARKYGIARELNKPLSLTEGGVVLQFEVRLQKGLECGGAYLKYLMPQKPGWTPKDFNNDSPYSIMFGPDKCGFEKNKVHFIFRHKNPRTGLYSEHHIKNPPVVPSFDNYTHVYTAIFKPAGKLWILVDGVEKKKVSFLEPEDFDPPLIPPKMIPDPNDKKPADWDERVKIPDPHATKPDEWDEDAPVEIPDEDATKPEGWLDDEAEEIDDPDATRPDDWDEEEDGEWEAPMISNPKCELAPGCGEWTRPMKKNPEYKGKWTSPLIDNPNYKGKWAPREIPNPDHFEIEKANIEPISAIGIEIWTMQDGILFDNILISKKEATAKSYRETLWLPKFELEELRAAEATAGASLSAFQVKMFELLYAIGDIPFLKGHKRNIKKFIEKAEKQPNLTSGILLSLLVLALSILYKIFLRGRKPTAVKGMPKKSVGSPSDSMDSIKENEKEDTFGPRRRSAKRED